MSLTTGTRNDVKIPRVSSTRQTETRDHETRQALSNEPISGLDAPTPPPGITYKWVRYYVGHNEDDKNVISHELKGWVNVRPDDITDPRFLYLKAAAQKRQKDRIQFGEMVLMQNDSSITDQARREADRAQQALNNTLRNPSEMQNLGDRKYIQATPVEQRRSYD